MRLALQWIKNNPILIAAGVLCVASLVMLFIVHVRGEAFVKKMSDRDKIIATMDEIQKTKVVMPPEEIDGTPVTHEKTINKKIIKKTEQVYDMLTSQYKDIFREAVMINRDGSNTRVSHVPMTEQLFPDTKGQAATLFAARNRYIEAFEEMVREHSDTALYPRLDAGGPLDTSILAQVEADAVREFFASDLVPRDINNLADKVLEDLEASTMREKIQAFKDHAERIHIYAGTDRQMSDWPFDLAGWCDQDNPPTLAEVWEGQMGLWLQQDIVQAIGETNQVSDANQNVLTAPIKRLLSIEVGNSYIGLVLRAVGGLSGGGARGLGGAGGGGRAGAGRGGRASGGRASSRASGGGTGGRSSATGAGKYYLSPTGRASNKTYDVRFVRVVVIVDWQRINEFIDKLAQTNFMTVLKVDIEDVDEYEGLREGYLYGTGDVVQATFLIETLWLREWTTMLMPEMVKQAMGIATKGKGSTGKGGSKKPGRSTGPSGGRSTGAGRS